MSNADRRSDEIAADFDRKYPLMQWRTAPCARCGLPFTSHSVPADMAVDKGARFETICGDCASLKRHEIPRSIRHGHTRR